MKLKETILSHKACLLLLNKVPFCLVIDTLEPVQNFA